MNKLLIMLLLISGNSFAVNKWVDEHGQTHYTDQAPPPHTRISTELTEHAPIATSAVPASNAKANIDPKERAKNKQLADDKLGLEETRKKEKAANCVTSQQNLSNLKEGVRITTIDPKTGERSYMEDQERATKISQYQEDVKKYCN